MKEKESKGNRIASHLTDPNRLCDETGDLPHMTFIPRVIWAEVRDAIDLAVWMVIKMIAGDDGECFVAGEKLAEMCMISEGKLSEVRHYWMSTGLLVGELKKVSGGEYPVWHMTIPDIWTRNATWRDTYSTLEERVAFKKRRREIYGWKSDNQRRCPRCGEMFTITGPQSVRCEDCSRAHKIEKNQVWRRLGSRSVGIQDARCSIIGCNNPSVEYHLPALKEDPVILCVDHHNELHRLQAEADRAAYEMNRSENLPSGLSQKPSGLSREPSGLSQKPSGLSRVVKEEPLRISNQEEPIRMASPTHKRKPIKELLITEALTSATFQRQNDTWLNIMTSIGVPLDQVRYPLFIQMFDGILSLIFNDPSSMEHVLSTCGDELANHIRKEYEYDGPVRLSVREV